MEELSITALRTPCVEKFKQGYYTSDTCHKIEKREKLSSQTANTAHSFDFVFLRIMNFVSYIES